MATPAPSPDPSCPAWAELWQTITLQAELARLAAEDLRTRWGSVAAYRQARLIYESIETLAGLARQQVWEQAAIDLEVERRLAERRGHLRAVRYRAG